VILAQNGWPACLRLKLRGADRRTAAVPAWLPDFSSGPPAQGPRRGAGGRNLKSLSAPRFAAMFPANSKRLNDKKIRKKIFHRADATGRQRFVAIAPALALTYIVQTWFWSSADWLKQLFLDVPWASFLVGLLALVAAWFGGEHFILRQVRAMSDGRQIATKGDWSARTGLPASEDELGQLAKIFDAWRSRCSSASRNGKTEKILLNRALQQPSSPRSDNSP
jgi:HAMP domain-containing protein